MLYLHFPDVSIQLHHFFYSTTPALCLRIATVHMFTTWSKFFPLNVVFYTPILAYVYFLALHLYSFGNRSFVSFSFNWSVSRMPNCLYLLSSISSNLVVHVYPWLSARWTWLDIGQVPAILTELAWSIRDLLFHKKLWKNHLRVLVYFRAPKWKPVLCKSDGAFGFLGFLFHPDKEITEDLLLFKENILRKTIFVHPLRDFGEMLLQEQNGQSALAEPAI